MSGFTGAVVKTGIFAKNPVVIVDVGCVGGFDEVWHAFKEHKILYGFEARGVPSMKTGPFQGQQEIFPYALTVPSVKGGFYVTQGRSSSSFFDPNTRIISRFQGAPNMKVLDTRVPPISSIDEFWPENNLAPIDYMDMDCEGSEMNVMLGGLSQMGNVLGVCLEATYCHWRAGQPIFRDIDRFMSELGFVLYNVQNYHLIRRVIPLQPRMPTSGQDGQLIFGHFYYFRDAMADMEAGICYDPIRLLKLACLFEIMGQWDSAYELMKFSLDGGIEFDIDVRGLLPSLK